MYAWCNNFDLGVDLNDVSNQDREFNPHDFAGFEDSAAESFEVVTPGMKNKIDLHNWTLRFVQLGALLVPFTALIATDTMTYLWIFPKAILFQIIVQILAAVWIILAISDKKYRPNWKNPIILSVSIFIGVLVLSLPFSSNITTSFWSTYGSMTGIVNLLHYWVWFLMLTSIYKTWADWKSLLIVTNNAALILDAIGILGWIQNPEQRAVSLFGNPIFFAAYLIPHIFIALILLKDSRKKFLKIFFSLSVILHSTLLVASSSRSAVFAVCAAVIVSAMLYIFYSTMNKRKKIYLLAPLATFVLLIFLGITALQTPSAQSWTKDNLPKQIHHLLTLDELAERQSLWSIGLSGFAQKPIFGWGVENYSSIYGEKFDPAIHPHGEGKNLSFKPHNHLISILSETGLVGFAAYLIMWISVFWSIVRKINKEKGGLAQWILLNILAIFVAYHIFNFFNFDTPAAMMVTFAILALTVFVTGEKENILDKFKNILTKSQINLFLIIPILILLLVSQQVINIQPAIKSYNFALANRVLQTNPDRGFELLNSSFKNNPLLDQQLYFLILNETNIATGNPSITPETKEALINLVSEGIARRAEREQNDFSFQILATAAERLRGVVIDPEHLNKAEEFALRASLIAPHRPEPYRELGEIYLVLGSIDKANTALQAALERETEEGHIARTNYRLAITSAVLGDIEKSTDYLQAALEKGYPAEQNSELVILISKTIDENDAVSDDLLYYTKQVYLRGDEPELLSAVAIIHAYGGQTDYAKRILDTLEKSNEELANNTRNKLGF